MRKAEQTRWPLAPEYASITDGGNQTSSAWYQGKSAPLADRWAGRTIDAKVGISIGLITRWADTGPCDRLPAASRRGKRLRSPLQPSSSHDGDVHRGRLRHLERGRTAGVSGGVDAAQTCSGR